jgi:hypothetical protein
MVCAILCSGGKRKAEPCRLLLESVIQRWRLATRVHIGSKEAFFDEARVVEGNRISARS